MADMDLVEFLRTRLDEEEQRLDDIDHVQAPAGHMARERREIEAKRQLIELAYRYAAHEDDESGCLHSVEQIKAGECEYTSPGDPGEIVNILAAVYADHPDYREEWKS